MELCHAVGVVLSDLPMQRPCLLAGGIQPQATNVLTPSSQRLGTRILI